jgi:hypothetical protein
VFETIARAREKVDAALSVWNEVPSTSPWWDAATEHLIAMEAELRAETERVVGEIRLRRTSSSTSPQLHTSTNPLLHASTSPRVHTTTPPHVHGIHDSTG